MKNDIFPFTINHSKQSYLLTFVTTFCVSNNLLHSAIPNAPYLLSGGLVCVFVQQGSIELINNGKHYKIHDHQIVLLHPGFITQFISISDDCQYIEIAIPLGSIMDFPTPLNIEIVNLVHHNFTLPFSNETFDELYKYVILYHEDFLQSADDDAEVLRALFFVVMAKMNNLYKRLVIESPKPLKSDKLAEKFFYHLSKHCKIQRSLHFYAEQMNLTQRHLSQAIRKATGRSPIAWINEITLWAIRTYLKTTDMTIFEIATELQFSSPSNLVLFFRQHMGITPLKYRKQEGW